MQILHIDWLRYYKTISDSHRVAQFVGSENLPKQWRPLRVLWKFQEFLDNLLDNSIREKTKKAKKYGMKIFNGKFISLHRLILFIRL